MQEDAYSAPAHESQLLPLQYLTHYYHEPHQNLYNWVFSNNTVLFYYDSFVFYSSYNCLNGYLQEFGRVREGLYDCSTT